MGLARCRLSFQITHEFYELHKLRTAVSISENKIDPVYQVLKHFLAVRQLPFEDSNYIQEVFKQVKVNLGNPLLVITLTQVELYDEYPLKIQANQLILVLRQSDSVCGCPRAAFLFERMAPIRMPRKFVTPPKSRTDVLEEEMNDHEMFLTAFEKPTQIYRYLETRHSESSVFLHRNLTYMMGYRMSRKRNTRSIGLNYIVDKLRRFREQSTAMLNLKFIGLFEDNSNNNLFSVEMNVQLIKTKLGLEKEKILIGKYKIPVNPFENNNNIDNDVNIFIDDFKRDEELCSCSLQFLVKMPNLKTTTRSGRPAKISQTVTDIISNEILICTTRNFHLQDGLYEVAFSPCSDKENESTISNCRWHSLTLNEEKEPKFSPCIRFQLTLSGLNIKRKNTRLNGRKRTILEKPIVFQFLYANFSQKTDGAFIPNCPWCTVNCGSMYSLLKHLRLCHHRFCFRYTKTSKEHRVIVKVNENFDGSHERSPYEYKFCESCLIPGPKRKYPCTKILVGHSRKVEPNLTEFAKFLDTEDKPLIEGHHRLYHHSLTGSPKYPLELGDDSEDENDPLWLRDSVTKMVDAFRDVNSGEKEIMKMWNLHILKYGFTGNCQMKLACNKFIEEHGKDIIDKNLYKNFLVHLSTLVDFEVISSKIMFETVTKLQEKMKNCDSDKLVRIFASSIHQSDHNMTDTDTRTKRKQVESTRHLRRNLRRRF